MVINKIHTVGIAAIMLQDGFDQHILVSFPAFNIFMIKFKEFLYVFIRTHGIDC